MIGWQLGGVDFLLSADGTQLRRGQRLPGLPTDLAMLPIRMARSRPGLETTLLPALNNRLPKLGLDNLLPLFH